MPLSDRPCADDLTLRELTSVVARMDAQLVAAVELAKERDDWYRSRDRDRQAEVERALIAAKEQTQATFIASKEAIGEAKKSQDSYNLTHNDLVRKMERQASESMSRIDIETRLKLLDDKIQEMKNIVTTITGRGAGVASSWNTLLGLIAAVATLIAIFSYTSNRQQQVQLVPVQPGVSLPLTLAPGSVPSVK